MTTGINARLHVTGANNTSATDAFTVQNSDNTVLMNIENAGNIGIGTLAPGSKLDISGDFSYRWTSPSTMGATENDYPTIGTSALRLTPDGAGTNITGFSGGTDGKELTIVNLGTSTIAITNQDTGSVATNRVINGSTTATVVLSADDTALYKYDGSTNRWRFMYKGSGQ